MHLHQVRDPVGDHTGFATARAGQQQEGPFNVGNSRLLLRIQTFEEIHGRACNEILTWFKINVFASRE